MFEPTTVLLEFLTWFAWLACFASIQSKLCRQYPGIRCVSRKAYLFTMVVPIVGSVWLMCRSDNGPEMFALLNRAFGAGVFAQIFLRSVVLLKWLVVTGFPHVALQGDSGAKAFYAESDLMALVGVLGATMRKPVAREQRRELERDRKMGD